MNDHHVWDVPFTIKGTENNSCTNYTSGQWLSWCTELSLNIYLQKQRELFLSATSTTPRLPSLVDDPLRSEDSQRGDRKKWFRAQETVIKILFLIFLISNDISNFSFQAKLQSAQSSSLAKVPRSLKGLENLCFCINFEFMQLWYNTVTKFHLTHEQDVYCQKVHVKKPLDAESECAAVVISMRRSI